MSFVKTVIRSNALVLQVMLLCLHHLPEHSTFNVVTFGTAYNEFFPTSQQRTKSNIKQAESFIQSTQAVHGNTEVYRPLHAYFLLNPTEGLRNVFLVSDGHINSEMETLKAVGENYNSTRVFTLGVS